MIANIAADLGGWAQVVLAVLAVIGSAVALVKWMDRHMARPLRQIGLIVDRQREIEGSIALIVTAVGELSSNGGSSLRDSIDRQEMMTQEILDNQEKI